MTQDNVTPTFASTISRANTAEMIAYLSDQQHRLEADLRRIRRDKRRMQQELEQIDQMVFQFIG